MDKGQGGIGALLLDVSRALAFPKVFALGLTILLIGIGLDYALRAAYNSYPANRKH
jgi:ABC-type nitrate/sulfonate/bicarbonate transport system permease component